MSALEGARLVVGSRVAADAVEAIRGPTIEITVDPEQNHLAADQ